MFAGNIAVICSYILYVMNTASATMNNVCPTIEDYHSIKENPNCWYDFTVDSNVTEIITKHGYPVEVHKGISQDGYILTIIRIPNTGTKKTPKNRPIFMQHGIYCSAADFVAKGKDSLAFLLADEGYDVWLGNFRGNQYSEGHINLTTKDRKYWDYSFDEMGLYDIPMQLKIIAEKTGQKGNIVYVGHSLGTTVALVYGSSYPEEAKEYVKLFILMSPVATLANMVTPFRLLAPFANIIYEIFYNNGFIRVVSEARLLKGIVQSICLDSPYLMNRCFQILNLLFGIKTQMGPELMPVQLSHYPAGGSLKLLRHVADLALNFFGRYNYGNNNFVKYEGDVPPKYNVSKIMVPVFIMYSRGDWISTKKDSLILYNKLPQQGKIYGLHEVADEHFNHNDFLYGKNVKSLVYKHILSLINKV